MTKIAESDNRFVYTVRRENIARASKAVGENNARDDRPATVLLLLFIIDRRRDIIIFRTAPQIRHGPQNGSNYSPSESRDTELHVYFSNIFTTNCGRRIVVRFS